MRRGLWIAVAGLVAAIALAALFGGPDAATGPAPETVRAAVKVATLERRALPGEVRAGGFLRAFADVTISAERSGRVVALPVAEGASVARGTVVARLDDTEAAANLDRARAVAREAALDPDVPAAELSRADEQLRIAEHELRLRNPAAPFDGRVEVHHIDVGEFVRAGTPLVDVIDARSLILDIDVDAEVIGALRQGDTTTVVVFALGAAGEREARITRLASRADARTRRFRVEITVPAGAGLLRPGMHAEGRCPVPGGPPAFYLPKAATRKIRGQTGLFVVVAGIVRWRPVLVAEIYHRPDLWRVVAGELEDGALLVVGGYSGLRDGTPVKATRTEAGE